MRNRSEVLQETHAVHHELLREELFTVLRLLVGLDVFAATAAFDDFADHLERGLAVEEDLVMPCYRVHGPKEGQGKPEIVGGDHVILRRGIDVVRAVLAAQPTSLRAVLEELPHVYRLLGTLEHHTARELKHVYPVVDVAFDDADRAAAVRDLVAVVAEQRRRIG